MADSEVAPALKTYRANCHCGAFVFEVTVPEITTLKTCNCSICVKKGYGWAFPTNPEDVNVVKGSVSDLTAYEFGPKSLQHLFCPICGTPVLGKRLGGEGKEESYGVNVSMDGFEQPLPATHGEAITLTRLPQIKSRTIQGLDIWSLPQSTFDGAALGDKYDAPPFTGPAPEAEIENAQTYTGSCHCGAVTFAFKTQPLADKTFCVDCNCSICKRNGYIWTYPDRNQLSIRGLENTASYHFGSGIVKKQFCKTCGVHVVNGWRDLSESEIAELTEKCREFYTTKKNLMPVNLRALNGFDLGGLKPTKLDGEADVGPEYVNP